MRPRLLSACAVLACVASSQPEEVPPPTLVPVAAPPPQPAAERLYVTASSLNLRTAPEPSASVLSKLPINAQVRRQKVEGDWARVTTPRGQEGWVGADYLGTEALTFSKATTERAAAKTDEDRLAWAQRAAALRPIDPPTLTALEEAYTAAGRNKEARSVAARLKELTGTTFEKWFPSTVRAEMEALQTQMDSVSTLAEFAAAHDKGLEVSRQVSEVIDGLYDYESGTFAGETNLDWLKGRLPGQQIAWAPEGLGAGTELAVEPWAEVAARTPSPEDDRFIELLSRTYENGSAGGWQAWQARNWDYGGCNTFSLGTQVEVLLLTDPLVSSPLFGTEARDVRESALKSILEDDEEFFPFCEPDTIKPSPGTRLTAQLQKVLDQVELTPDERTQLEARKARGWPKNP